VSETPPRADHAAAAAIGSGMNAVLDPAERTILFLDTLRRRGNTYLEHIEAGAPALLKFGHELILDGRELARPCNYALLRVQPPPGVPAAPPSARPVVVVDPRAGHGPGIGGFKEDSEVGVALRAGHPVYFVTFRPQPEDGQTLWDVMDAEARFLEEVIARHPDCKARPIVVGNCQAGWAISMLASVRPELFGPLMVVGAPLSYWAGSSKLNPMRYSGATLGGAWLAALTADLAGNRFDGAHLVHNFENLNPANTWWSKHYRLWSHIDTEAERFLEFERWWGGFFRMTGDEIEAIVENLFVGNRLARGEVMAGDRRIDLREIRSPMIVFASWGDNITPPPQALDWIIDTWGDERAIAAAGRVIVYVLHETVGHLGIFVGADIARKEHDQIVSSLDVVENLPPGLYEMKVVLKDGRAVQRWDQLEPGSYTVNFEHRTMDELRAVNPEGRDEERNFAAVARVSEMNTAFYKAWIRPWLRAMPLRPFGNVLTELHPLRLQRRLFSDAHPAAWFIARAAEHVRANRHALAADDPARAWEQPLSQSIEKGLNTWRDLRDEAVVQWTRAVFGPWGLGAALAPRETDEARAQRRAHEELDAQRGQVLATVADGGFAQAVCRIVLAGMKSVGSFERRSFRLAGLLAQFDDQHRTGEAASVDWKSLLRAEARIAALAPVEALVALGQMLPDTATRERALAVAAAVMMIEPTLANPRSEIIELLIGMLEVDAQRVMDLALSLTHALASPARAPVAATAVASPPGRPRRSTRRPTTALHTS
jgi:hypothetical protein